MSDLYLASILNFGNCPTSGASFDTCVFLQILIGPTFLIPTALVLALTLVCQTSGVILGFPLALGRISKNRLYNSAVSVYLYLFRGTPLLLQILFFWDGLDEITGHSPALFFITRNAIIAGGIALALNEAAYMTEIIRAGLQAIDPGQADAAKALGMTRWQAMRHIVVPQAMRIIVPPTGNEYINMSKNTSLLSVIAVMELLDEAERWYATNFRPFEALGVAAIWYLLITTILTRIQARIEARFGERIETEIAARPGFLRRAFIGGLGAPRAGQ